MEWNTLAIILAIFGFNVPLYLLVGTTVQKVKDIQRRLDKIC